MLCYLEEDADVSLFMPNPLLHLFSWRLHGSLVKALTDLGSNMILKNESPFSFLYFFSCPLPFSVSVCLCLSISCVYEHVHVFVHDVCKWCLLTTGSCIPPGSKRKGLGNFPLLPIISLLVSKLDFKLTLGFLAPFTWQPYTVIISKPEGSLTSWSDCW